MTKHVQELTVDDDGPRKAVKLRVEFDRPEREREPKRVVVTDEHYYATNPTTGLDAVFLPGEVIPDWALGDEDRARLGIDQAEEAVTGIV